MKLHRGSKFAPSMEPHVNVATSERTVVFIALCLGAMLVWKRASKPEIVLNHVEVDG